MEMRPELARVISMAKQTGATIVVETMDRLARNAHVYEQIRREAGVQIVVVKAPSDDPDLHLRALARGAEVERDLIVERTAAGRERAKASGARFRSGDPRRGGKARGAQITAAARKVAADLRPTIEGITADLGSLALNGLAEKLNELGIGAPLGGRWSAKQVSRLLTRLSDLDACPPASPEAPRMTLGARKSHKTEFAVFFW